MLHILSSASSASSASSVSTSPRAQMSPLSTSPAADPQRLPLISAGGFEAHALCVVGETQANTGKTYIAYLSLLGAGTAVAAIWAALMDQRQLVVSLDEVGPIQLWQRQPALAALGYAIPWRRRTRVLQLAHGVRLVHLVTEPDLLTIRIPEDVEARGRKRRRSDDAVAGGGGSARGSVGSRNASHAGGSGDTSIGRAMNTPQVAGGQREPGGQSEHDEDAAAIEQMSEQVAQETRPLFALLGLRGEDEATLARRHLLFLAERIQWLAYYEPWATGIWRRGLQTGEIRPLTVWPTANAEGVSDHNSFSSLETSRAVGGDPFERWIASAYCCQPLPLVLAADLPVIVRAARSESSEYPSLTGAATISVPAPAPPMPQQASGGGSATEDVTTETTTETTDEAADASADEGAVA